MFQLSLQYLESQSFFFSYFSFFQTSVWAQIWAISRMIVESSSERALILSHHKEVCLSESRQNGFDIVIWLRL